jgi:4-amino-4-deoxy-L-arabinose transferase-like glycosyltransferase
MASQPTWARPRQVALIILAYLLVHLGVRLWIGRTLGLDDAEQALFGQQWLLNYRFRAPPLFTWALLATGQLTDINALAISLLRYGLLAMIAGFTYLTARALIRDPRLAALATFSFAAIYVFGYYSHHDLTHTTVLAAFLAASWYAFVRLCEKPSLGRYLALGGAFGLGLLGKWNFMMFAVALPLACLTQPRERGLVLNWRILPAALLTAAIALPSALWAIHVGPAVGDGLGTLLGEPARSRLGGLVLGTADLLLAAVVYPMPFLAIFLAVLGPAAWRGLKASAPPTPPEPIIGAHLVGMVMAIALMLHWLLVPLVGATNFSERLLQPALQILPVYLFMLVERGRASDRALNLYAHAIAAVAVVAVVARILVQVACPGACRALVPFQDVAQHLGAAGFGGSGTIVVSDFHVGGNMRVQFPHARVVEISYPPRVWPPPSGHGQCLVLWPGKGNMDGALDAYLSRELGVPTDARRREGEMVIPLPVLMPGSKTRAYRLFYRLYEESQGDCR